MSFKANLQGIRTVPTYSPSDHQLLYQSLASDNETGIRTVLDNINWTPEAIDGLQRSVLNNDVFQFCTIDNNTVSHHLRIQLSCMYTGAENGAENEDLK